MKRLIAAAVLFAIAAPAMGQVHVRGYYRKDGTYVQPYERTRPNSTTSDNYDTPGNYNPNTGRITPEPRSEQPLYRAPTYTPPTYQPSTPPSYTPYKAPCYYNCSK